MRQAKSTISIALVVAVIALLAGLIGGWIGAEHVIDRQQQEEKADALARFNAIPTCLESAKTEISALGCIASAAMLARDIKAKMDEWRDRSSLPLAAPVKAEVRNMIVTARQKLQRGQAYPGEIGSIRMDIPEIIETIGAAEAWTRE